ncbi:T3SS effector HopA1 family protein [Anabaena cylindrica UHCC 0172]|uniref:T3SS effector HopA1 family protein n=1 Tax=Anabaena cylindrica TaxID=1165 RepID=UPI002B20A280|nr:T3SS effector HopA1 family protein [Anabaena cylindrica]MEA5554075.1 T3SS effector HopA1 family protein [Anabaena cylindrica UHCC 0172]
MLDNSTNQILNSLFDIATNIQIEPNFCIQHPNYQPFALPATVANRFQQNSQDLQHKYLSLLLRNFLHGIYYNGSLQTVLAVNSEHENYSPQKTLDQSSSVGIDWDFYEQLHKNNHGHGHDDPNWEVLRLEPDRSMAVTKNALTLYVEPECYLKSHKKSVKAGELISIWMPKNRLQNGCYVAVSNLGQERQGTPKTNVEVGRIYFNFTPSGAIALMDSLTQQLNTANIPFSFEVLYNPSAYGRYDAGILHFERQDYPAIHKILQVVYKQHQSYFQPEIPLFTKFLAPGLSLAEEPSQKFAAQESFGMNRCQIVANALLEAWDKGKNAIEERMRIIDQHFAQHLIDVQRPYLNPSSEDIYIPLNC